MINMKMIYRAAALLTAAALALSLCGCGRSSGGSADSSSASAEQAAMTAAELFDKVSGSGLCPELDERAELGSDVFANACEKLYSEPAESFSDGGIMFVSSGAKADEVSVLASDSADCKKLLEERKKRRYKDYEGYAPAELEKIENARIFSAGGLWVMVISDNAEDAEKLICGK